MVERRRSDFAATFSELRLVEPAADEEHDHREDGAGREADPPAPRLQRGFAELACKTTSNASAISWPPMMVTYWKLDQKPRRSRSAISER